MQMNVGQECSQPAITVAVSATLAEAAALMRERNVGAVIVTQSPSDRPTAVGVITDRDIVRAQLEHTADLSSLGVEQAMSRDPLEINAQCDIGDAIRRMRERGVRRAPIVSDNGTLSGVVSIDDLIARVAEDLVGISSILAKQAHL
jgi:CBS domain-containing protein